jgi:HEAT repeat protein
MQPIGLSERGAVNDQALEIRDLQKHLEGTDSNLARDAVRRLILLGFPFTEILSARAFSGYDSLLYSGDVANILRAHSVSETIAENLARAIVEANDVGRLTAIQICADLRIDYILVINALILATQDSYSRVRSDAVDLLGNIGGVWTFYPRELDVPVFNALIATFTDQDPDVALHAIMAIKKLGKPFVVSHESLKLLVRWLFSPAIRSFALAVLKVFECPDPFVLDGLQDFLTNQLSRLDLENKNQDCNDYEVAAKLFDCLKGMYRRSIAPEQHPGRGSSLIQKGVTTPVLIEKLHSGIEDAIALCKLGDQNAISVLIEALKHPEVFMRTDAATALGKIGGPTPVVVPALIGAMKDPKWYVRRGAAEALGMIGISAMSAVPALAAALMDEEDLVRSDTREALQRIGGSDVSVPALIAALAAPNEYARREAAEALTKIGEQAIPGLDKARFETDALTRVAVVQILATIAPHVLKQDPTNVESNHPPHTPEDDRILSWFKQVRVEEYMQHLQVFWCIGYVDRDAMKSSGLAMGYKKLSELLNKREPHYKHILLHVSDGHIRSKCLPNLDGGLFDLDPFLTHAWTDEERRQAFREPDRSPGGKMFERWTPKAWKAWTYVDRFLSLNDLVPEMNNED